MSNVRPRVPANKACPVVLRTRGSREILVFEHPLAGIQLVKGTIELGESPEAAALRELGEESGITSASWVRSLGTWSSFRFFWHPLFGAVSSQWHPLFQQALRFIQNAA